MGHGWCPFLLKIGGTTNIIHQLAKTIFPKRAGFQKSLLFITFSTVGRSIAHTSAVKYIPKYFKYTYTIFNYSSAK